MSSSPRSAASGNRTGCPTSGSSRDSARTSPEFPAHFGRNLLIEKDFTAISTARCSQNLFGLPLTVPNSPRDIWGMVRKPRTVHVAKITNTVKGVTYTSYYLRRSFRLDGKVKHETLGNLSDLPVHVIDLISRSLKERFRLSSGIFL